MPNSEELPKFGAIAEAPPQVAKDMSAHFRLTGGSKPTHDDLLASASKAPISHHHPSQNRYMPHHLDYLKG